MDERIEKTLTVVLAVALVAALGGVVYVAMTPGSSEERFTEFYVLGPDGNASDYPTNLSVGEEGEFIVGIANHEQQPVTYTMVVTVDGEPVERAEIAVDNGDERTRRVTFTPDSVGEKRVRIFLYKSQDPDLSTDADQFLRLSVDVSENNASQG